jgi:purine-nucleoside phosphorylase
VTPELAESLKYITEKNVNNPKTAIILGSGLGSFANHLQNKKKIQTSSIPHYPASTVTGHAGFLVFGELQKIPVLAVQGRTHFYEGYDMRQITFVVRLLFALGIRLLIVTNAAGAVNEKLRPGDLMLIADHLNFMFQNPLRGPLDFGGVRFPDMSDVYSREYTPKVDQIALSMNIPLKHGVLCAVSGPSYETAAEIKMLRNWSVDAVSMSTVPEVIVARQAGIKVIGISCITNMASGISNMPLKHSEVTEMAAVVEKKFIKLVTGIITQI